MDLKEFTEEFKEKTKTFPKEVVIKFLDEESKKIARETLRRTPVRTGRLKSGWRLSHEKLESDYEVTIYNYTHYASYVEYGTVNMSPRYMLTVPLNRFYHNLDKNLNKYFEEHFNFDK